MEQLTCPRCKNEAKYHQVYGMKSTMWIIICSQCGRASGVCGTKKSTLRDWEEAKGRKEFILKVFDELTKMINLLIGKECKI